MRKRLDAGKGGATRKEKYIIANISKKPIITDFFENVLVYLFYLTMIKNVLEYRTNLSRIWAAQFEYWALAGMTASVHFFL